MKDTYFSVPLDQNSREFVKFHVPVFWTRPRTTVIYKAAENYTLTPEKNQGQSDKIFGRYVDFESHNPTLHKK